MKVPYDIYQEFHSTLDLAMRLGASGIPEAVSVLCAGFRAEWEAAEKELAPDNEYSQFIRKVFERDGWICQLRELHCTKHEHLTCHHVIPLSHGGELLNTDNGITLCQNCHMGVTNGGRETNWKAFRPFFLAKIKDNQEELEKRRA